MPASLRIDRWVGPVGRVQRSIGTDSKRVLREINDTISYLVRHGLWGPLEDVRDGRIRPIDLLQLYQSDHVPGKHHRECFIYVIRAVSSGNIKIGIAYDPARRVRSIRSANHEQIELIYFFPGNGARERRIHRHLADARVRGEWFRPTDTVLAWIEKNRPEPALPLIIGPRS